MIKLRKGEKARRENVPIALNDVQDHLRQVSSEMSNKGNVVTLSVQTCHFGTGASNKQSGTSFGKKVAHKLDRIENNPLPVISTLLTVYRELLPAMVDVGPITAWELFKTLCTGTAVAEFNSILERASAKTYLQIEQEFNREICKETDKESDKAKAWIKKNQERKDSRRGYPIADYDFSFPPDPIPKPPRKAPNNKLVAWSTSGVQGLDALGWLNLHKHGWEYAELLHDHIMKEVKTLAFRVFGPEAGRNQIDYLSEDLKMDPSHNISVFLRLLDWFSEAQLLYPKLDGDEEVGSLFTQTRKTNILWNYAFENFKDEINNMNKTRASDFRTFQEAKDAFLLAEERKNKKAGTSKAQGDANKSKKSKIVDDDNKEKDNPGKGKDKGKEKSQTKTQKICGWCGKPGHLATECFNNPHSSNFKGDKSKSQDKKRKTHDLNAAEVQEFLEFKKLKNATADSGYTSA